jgi:hypothetical protein
VIKRFLLQPYPLEEAGSKRVLTAILFGLFIFLFLYLFRPFGLQELPFNEAPFIISGYGVITTAIILFNHFILPNFFPFLRNETKWNVLKEILITLWTISAIGIVNMLYTNFFFEHSFSLVRLAFFQGVTFLVAFFPVTFSVMMKQMILLKRNLAEAEKISSNLNYKKRLQGVPDATVEIVSENKKENLVLKVCDILYITSADNYVEVYFLDDGIIISKLIRTSLKAARENLKLYTAFYRCHRAWIVNLDQVKRVTGNSQGYRLILNYGDIEIPVSRNLNEEITNRLSK